jgi:hypothetical protein
MGWRSVIRCRKKVKSKSKKWIETKDDKPFYEEWNEISEKVSKKLKCEIQMWAGKG